MEGVQQSIGAAERGKGSRPPEEHGMIEFTAQADMDVVEAVLVEVGNSGNFAIRPDRFIRSNAAYKKFVLLAGSPSEHGAAQECGTVELTRKRGSQVAIKINASTDYSGERLTSAVDRFFYLFTQRLLQQKLVTVEPSRGVDG